MTKRKRFTKLIGIDAVLTIEIVLSKSKKLGSIKTAKIRMKT